MLENLADCLQDPGYRGHVEILVDVGKWDSVAAYSDDGGFEVAERTPGIVSTVTTELAMNDINMMEFMSCVPELIIVVDEKDALRSYDAIENLGRAPSEFDPKT